MRRVLPLVLILCGCSQGAEADLQYIKQARSIAAEWALVNEQSNEGKLTPTYVASMHRWLRDQLRTSSQSLSVPNSPYGDEIQALMRVPDDAAPDQLRSHANALKHLEDSLESA